MYNNLTYEILQDIKRHDQGIYRCRVDFRTAQTQSFRFNLSVISEYPKCAPIPNTHIVYLYLYLSIVVAVVFSTSGATHHTGPLGSSTEWHTIGSQAGGR